MRAEAHPKLEFADVRLIYPGHRPQGSGEEPNRILAVDLKGAAEAPPIRIAAAEFAVILGPSGCGKSSLLRMAAGLLPPTEGKVFSNGLPVEEPSRDRGMVFQAYACFPWLTVFQNVLFGLTLDAARGSSRFRRATREEKDQALTMIEKVGLTAKRDQYPGNLSGGEQQRVAIARALVGSPQVLLMDEPFGALDSQTRMNLQRLVLDLVAEQRITVLFVTHDVREAVYLGDTIYISTLLPCFLKYRLEHPFRKDVQSRDEARQRSPRDFRQFQHEVEEKLEFLSENPAVPRVIEAEDFSVLKRSTLGILEHLSDNLESGTRE